MKVAALAALAVALCLPLEATLAQFAHRHPESPPAASTLPQNDVDDRRVVDLLRRAKESSEKYQDRRMAILDGYRRIGPDFPGMGEHWINLGSLMGGADPERPTFLSYAELEGQLRLIGLAYAVPLGEGDEPPKWPGTAGAWHDHIGTVEEEVLLTQTGTHAGGGNPRARLAMLHAWVWLENPDGPFAKENWALPFARLGLVPPRLIPVSAARALSLVTHTGYHEMLLERVAAASDRERDHLRAMLSERRVLVERVIAGRRGASLDDGELRELVQLWEQLWRDSEQALTPRAAGDLRRVLGLRSPEAHAQPR